MEIKIVLIEDHDVVSDGIRALLDGEENLTVVGQARNGTEVLDVVHRTKPDVVVIDMNMPVMNGLECAKRLLSEYPEVRILILALPDHENYLIDLLDAGAQGYILKNASKDELVFAINRIANKGMYFGAEFTLNMLQRYKAIEAVVGHGIKKEHLNISDREMEVLHLVSQGKTNAEIARTLFTSVRTIETRRKNLLDKTQTNNTATLIRYAVLNGLVK